MSTKRSCAIGLVIVYAVGGVLHATVPTRFAVATAAAQDAAGSRPVYKPPMRGAPGGRVGGATRGATVDTPTPVALVPNHTGLTTREQPTLYWYLPRTTTLPVELTIIEANAVPPMVEVRLPAPERPGIQRIRLADHNIRLKPEVTYRWYVALIADPSYRSKDILTGGLIERVDATAVGLTSPPPDDAAAPRRYAEAGLWYDAIDAISALLERSPQDAALRADRAALLEQVGLRAVADADRGAAPSAR